MHATISGIETVLFVAQRRDLDELRGRNPSFYYLACAAMGAKAARKASRDERWVILAKALTALDKARKASAHKRGHNAGTASVSARNAPDAVLFRRDFAIEADRQIGAMQVRTGKSKSNCAGLVLKALRRKPGPFTIPDGKYTNGRALLEMIRREREKRPW
jgi:hypothetical protein